MSTLIFDTDVLFTEEELEEQRKAGLYGGRSVWTSGKSFYRQYKRPFYYPTVIKK